MPDNSDHILPLYMLVVKTPVLHSIYRTPAKNAQAPYTLAVAEAVAK